MPTEADIYRSANVLIGKHGEDAEVIAGMQADACAEEGDLDGKAAWLRIIRAIKDLRDVTPPADPSKVQ